MSQGSTTGGTPPISCDFCGRSSTEAGPMIEGKALQSMGPGQSIAHICDNCVDVCEGLFAQHDRQNTKLDKLPKPRELVARRA